MALHTRPNGTTSFTDDPAVDPATGVKIDAELNGITSVVNALDNANISGSPQIAGSKIDLTAASYLPLAGGSLSGLLTHNFDGIFRKMRAAGNGRIREYRGSDGAIWGISYNTEWDGAAWTGRDVTDICAVLKIQSDGLHYFHAVSAAAGVTPTWVELFHVNASKLITTESIQESSISWANAGGISQSLLSDSEVSTTSTSMTTLTTCIMYVPPNASTLQYYARTKVAATGRADMRLYYPTGPINGTTLTGAQDSTTYGWVGTGTIDITTLSGWTVFEIQLSHTTGSSTAYVDKVVGRFI